MRRWTALGLLATLVLAACGDDSGGFGKPGNAARASRTIDVRIVPSRQYEPKAITVKPGETVTFRVVNQDNGLHEFVIGDEKVHEDHDEEMAGMPMEQMRMADRSNRISMDGGQTSSLTWTFPSKKGAKVIYGSHVPGDYKNGLKGTITVS